MKLRFQGQDIPFLETREQAYTDAIIRQIQDAASADDGTLDPNQTSAGRTAARLLAGSLSAAVVSPDPLAETLNPKILWELGEALTYFGEAVFYVGADLRLERAYSWDVSGSGQSESTWSYKLSIGGPDQEREETVMAGRVFHPRINVAVQAPHQGQGFMALTGTSGLALAAAERSLSNELRSPSGRLIPHPEFMAPKELATLTGKLKSLKGRSTLVPSMAQNAGTGRSGAPPGDWVSKRFGGDPPESVLKIRNDLHRHCLGACGISTPLYEPKDATSSREALRQYLHTVVKPVANVVLTEARMKLLPDADFDFSPLSAADVQGRSRALKGLTESGVPLDKALRWTGFEE